jgi:hypothetical protein
VIFFQTPTPTATPIPVVVQNASDQFAPYFNGLNGIMDRLVSGGTTLILGLAILVFGLIVVACIIYLVRRGGKEPLYELLTNQQKQIEEGRKENINLQKQIEENRIKDRRRAARDNAAFAAILDSLRRTDDELKAVVIPMDTRQKHLEADVFTMKTAGSEPVQRIDQSVATILTNTVNIMNAVGQITTHQDNLEERLREVLMARSGMNDVVEALQQKITDSQTVKAVIVAPDATPLVPDAVQA